MGRFKFILTSQPSIRSQWYFDGKKKTCYYWSLSTLRLSLHLHPLFNSTTISLILVIVFSVAVVLLILQVHSTTPLVVFLRFRTTADPFVGSCEKNPSDTYLCNTTS